MVPGSYRHQFKPALYPPKTKMAETLVKQGVDGIGYQAAGPPLYRQLQRGGKQRVDRFFGVVRMIADIADRRLIDHARIRRSSKEHNCVSQKFVIFVIPEDVKTLTRLSRKLPI